MTLSDQPKYLARKSAVLYFLLIPLGLFGLMYIPEILIEIDNSGVIYQNFFKNLHYFRLNIFFALLIQIIQVFLVLSIYDLLKVVNRSIVKMMVFFIILVIPIAMTIELLHSKIFYLINHHELGGLFTIEQIHQIIVFTTEQVHQIIMLLLNAHGDGVMVACIVWGLWLFPMGYLILRSQQ